MFDKLHEECGVFGIYCRETTDVAEQTFYALYALQHRGQEASGIVVNDEGVFTEHKDLGLVNEVFSKDELKMLGHGNIAVGHVKYSDDPKSNRSAAQPLYVRHIKGPMAISYNGALTNATELREGYENHGAIFQSNTDCEVISQVITEQRLTQSSIEKAVEQAMPKLKGAYSLVIMSPQKLIAARDPKGFRPLCMGRCDDGTVAFASESCAFDAIGVSFERDILPGEIVVADESGIRSIRSHCSSETAMCVFEYVYFARSDSVIEGTSVHRARLRAGEILWKEHPVDADIVVGVPDSGLDAALGFSRASGIPYGVGFIKNRYIGRTFIQTTQAQRMDSVKIKLNALADTIKGKRVVLVDDSIVRGTTCKHIINLIREAGAKEVHMRLSSPPFTNPCYFGTDIDSKEKLIACRLDLEGISREICVDSLGYLSVEGVKSLAPEAKCGFCTGCFTGEYPLDPPAHIKTDKFAKKIGSAR